MNIQQLAKQYADWFETAIRNNGTDYIRLRTEDAQIKNLIYEAHDDMLPDDYKYQFIHEALEAIAEHDDIEDINLEPDIYNCDLLKWVSSHLSRASYCNDAIENMLGFQDEMDFMAIVSMAQSLEKDKVLQSVRTSLEEICATLNEEK